jgi:hypothetical protein
VDFSTIIAIAAPLVGEAVSMFARLRTASSEDAAAIVMRLDAALSVMRAAKSDEAAAHDARTAETRQAIADALAGQSAP